MRLLFLLITTACFLVAASTADGITLSDDQIPDPLPRTGDSPGMTMEITFHKICGCNRDEDPETTGPALYHCVEDCVDRYAEKANIAFWFDPGAYMDLIKEGTPICEKCVAACREAVFQEIVLSFE